MGIWMGGGGGGGYNAATYAITIKKPPIAASRNLVFIKFHEI